VIVRKRWRLVLHRGFVAVRTPWMFISFSRRAYDVSVDDRVTGVKFGLFPVVGPDSRCTWRYFWDWTTRVDAQGRALAC